MSSIQVTSNVARDFLQNADYFSTMPKVAWEYISNALDNPRDGQAVVVDVSIAPTAIVVSDNASGMTREDLERFFQMHAENAQRKKGRIVRGRFGTGKSAAFGIAKTLRIETRKSGVFNVVELKREDIEAAADGRDLFVREVVVDQSTEDHDGTRVVISRLNDSRRLDVDETRRYVERHLGRHLQTHSVVINDHPCEFLEPVFVNSYEFTPPPQVQAILGDAKLIVKVSPTPLDAEFNGIDVVAHGIWHDTTLSDLARDGMVRRLFGEVACDVLETWEGEPSPFDNTRNNTLNTACPLVVSLLGWVSSELRGIVARLDEDDRERRKTDEAKKLSREAARIDKLLNDDFQQLQRQLKKIRKDQGELGLTSATIDTIGRPTSPADPDGHILPGEGEQATDFDQAGPPHGDGHRGLEGSDGDEPRPGSGLLPGNQSGGPHTLEKKQRPRTTFHIDFVHETAERDRSHYDREARTIFINLDHPQLVSALKVDNNLEGRAFRQVAYELAFVEYALAVMTEEAHRLAGNIDAHDLLWDLHRTINRVAARVLELL
jgi:hypothetical protein